MKRVGGTAGRERESERKIGNRISLTGEGKKRDGNKTNIMVFVG